MGIYLSLVLLGCAKSEIETSENIVKQATEQAKKIEIQKDELIEKRLRLTADEIYLLDNKGDIGNKIINKKATAAIGETQYLTVDTSCIVLILEHEADWVKVQVIDPDWLKSSHIGWMKTKYLEGFSPKVTVSKDFYRIVLHESNGNVENVYVVYMKNDITPEIARALIFQIRLEIENANINVFANEKIIQLFKKYPLEKNEYLKVADQYICRSSFDAPLAVGWYPYQDILYKEYGGNNWKKDPL